MNQKRLKEVRHLSTESGLNRFKTSKEVYRTG